MDTDEMKSVGNFLRDNLGTSVILMATEIAPNKVSFLSMVLNELI